AVLLGIGAFLVQLLVQGVWGVLPTCLTELMPMGARAMLTGFVYHFGHVIASPHSALPASRAERLGGSFSMPRSVSAATVALIVAGLVFFGKVTKGKNIESDEYGLP